MNQNFEQRSVVLRIMTFPELHTAANITSMIEDVLKEFEIPAYRIHFIVCDTVANIVKGINDTGHDHLSWYNMTIFEQMMIKRYYCTL